MFRYLGRTFAFQGRAGRGEAWTMSIVMTVVISIVGIAVGVPMAIQQGLSAPPPELSLFTNLASMVLLAGVTVRRLHDRDKEAWWLVTYWVMPAIYMAVANPMEQLKTGAPIAPWQIGLLALTGGVVVWSFIDLYVLPAAPGADRFGPDPSVQLEPNVEQHFT